MTLTERNNLLRLTKLIDQVSAVPMHARKLEDAQKSTLAKQLRKAADKLEGIQSETETLVSRFGSIK
jgi:hypothetical protein